MAKILSILYPLTLTLIFTFHFPLFAFSQTETNLHGRPANAYPHFRHVQNLNADQALHIAIDPKLHPSIANLTADVYVVAHRTAAEWQQNPTLTDVTPNGAQSCTFGPDSIQQNTFLLAAPNELAAYTGPQIGVAYDIIIDMDHNAQLSAPDFIDGGDGPGFYVLHDITQPGLYAVTTQDYTSTAYQRKRIWYPTDIANLDPLPLIVISHGWTYTYTYYDYIGEHLASYGYIVMSHRNDVGFGDPQGTNTAAVSLIANIDHLIANQGALWGGVLNGKIDYRHMGWMGHSTGGESPVRAYTRLHNGTFTSPYYDWPDVQYISSFCPVAWFSGAEVNPYEVNYHQFLGGADTDASGIPADEYTQPLTIYERGVGNKHVMYVHGAGHAVFHNNAGSNPLASGPDLITRTQLHPIVKAYLVAMSDLYCKQNPAGKEFFTRSYSEYRPMNVSDSVVISNEYRDAQTATKQVIDDFETHDSLQLASSGAAVAMNVRNPAEVLMQDLDTSFAYAFNEPANGMTRARFNDSPHCLVMEWDSTTFLQYTIPDAIKDFSGYEFLSFRACQRTHHPLNVALDTSIHFQVTLVDENGDSAAIPTEAYGPIVRTYQRDGGWQNEFCTVRIRLAEFLVNGTQLDLNAIENLRFNFGGMGPSPMGALGIDDIELVNSELDWPTEVVPEQANEADIFVYPNPSTGEFMVDFPHSIENGKLEIFSLLGENFHSESITHESKKEIHLLTISTGIYFVKVSDAENTYWKKVIIRK
jgi:hypothetical protein